MVFESSVLEFVFVRELRSERRYCTACGDREPMNVDTPLRMNNIHANATGTLATLGASPDFVADNVIAPTNHQRVSQANMTVSTLAGSRSVEQYSRRYQITVAVSTTNAMAAQVI